MSSTITYDLDVPMLRSILWQYEESDSLISLVKQKQAWYEANVSRHSSGWTDSVFNLKTANIFGCVVWAIILQVPVEVVYQPTAETIPFGFGGGRENLRFSNFTGQSDTQTLTLDEARRLLRLKYYAQTISPTISNLNRMLSDVFGDLGSAYMGNGGGTVSQPFGFDPYQSNFFMSNFNFSILNPNIAPMEQVYTFKFPLSPNFKAALISNDILPRGSGVKSSIVVI